MSASIEDLSRCMEEEYRYTVRHLASHTVRLQLNDGEDFETAVEEFEIVSGSRWPRCYVWPMRSADEERKQHWPHSCFAVPKFGLITDAVAAVRWVYGLPVNESRIRATSKEGAV